MTIQLKPEQERIIQEEIRSGHFRSADEVLDHALAALLEKESHVREQRKPGENLLEVLSQPPFAGSELNLERQKDYPRPINL